MAQPDGTVLTVDLDDAIAICAEVAAGRDALQVECNALRGPMMGELGAVAKALAFVSPYQAGLGKRIEALLAERDELKAENERLRANRDFYDQCMLGQKYAECDALKAERDELQQELYTLSETNRDMAVALREVRKSIDTLSAERDALKAETK